MLEIRTGGGYVASSANYGKQGDLMGEKGKEPRRLDSDAPIEPAASKGMEGEKGREPGSTTPREGGEKGVRKLD